MLALACKLTYNRCRGWSSTEINHLPAQRRAHDMNTKQLNTGITYKTFKRPLASPAGMAVPYFISMIANDTDKDCFTLSFHPEAEVEVQSLTLDSVVVDYWCDQTGGMTMVDVLVLADTRVVTVTDECAMVWDSLTSYRETCGDGPEIERVIFFGEQS